MTAPVSCWPATVAVARVLVEVVAAGRAGVHAGPGAEVAGEGQVHLSAGGEARGFVQQTNCGHLARLRYLHQGLIIDFSIC